ncbi:hypothetical protein [Aquabacterium sp.]|uniref:hypothetical protein n=1 Tax=Aquabacterium sp. TaxID=1872578 RepID=UPI003B6DB8BE
MSRNVASSTTVALRRIGLVALACSAVFLQACGGGSRAKSYEPTRIVSFGDENSVLDSYSGSLRDASGAAATLYGLTYSANYTLTTAAVTCQVSGSDPATGKFCASSVTVDDGTTSTFDAPSYTIYNTTDYPSTVNAWELGSGTVNGSTVALKRTTSTTYYCNTASLWIQSLALSFGKGYRSECPLTSYSGAETYAEAGAKVADVATQVDNHLSELGSGVMVTIMAGQNDILELYAQVKANTLTLAQAQTIAQERADALAVVVKKVIATGAKVVLALTPDLGESPLAYTTGENRTALAALTKSFNDQVYITRLGEESGRNLAGVNPVSLTNTTTRSTSYVYEKPLCNTATTNTATRPDGTTLSVTPDVSNGFGRELTKFCTASTYVTDGSLSTYMWADLVRFAPAAHALIGSTAATRAANQF